MVSTKEYTFYKENLLKVEYFLGLFSISFHEALLHFAELPKLNFIFSTNFGGGWSPINLFTEYATEWVHGFCFPIG